MKKEFKGLLRSEITKCERYAKKVTGLDCEVTGYGARISHPIDFDQTAEYVDCDVEMCRKDNGRLACHVSLTIPMFDRRMSYINKF